MADPTPTLSRRNALLLMLLVPGGAMQARQHFTAPLTLFTRKKTLSIYLGDHDSGGFDELQVHGPHGEVLTFTTEQIMEALRG